MPDGKLPVSTKLLFSLGESVQGIWTVIAGFYLNVYFLEICCLDPGHVGAIQLVQGMFDAFNDPLIGYLSDHTRTRWGRRRPWLLLGAPVLALSYFGLWSKVPNDFPTSNFVYYLVCYMGVTVGITCVQIQIASMVPELTDDYDERTVISAYRLGAVVVAGGSCLVVHSLILKAVPTPSDAYQLSGAAFAVVILVSILTVFCCIREKFIQAQESDEKLSMWQELKWTFCNKAFMCVVFMYLCGPTAMVLIQSNIYLLSKYVLGNEDDILFIMATVQGGVILGAPFWIAFCKRFGKREMYFLAGPILVVAFTVVFFADTLGLALLASGLIGLSFFPLYLGPYSLLPDVIEHDELATGKRREGIFAGFFTISLKLTVTLALTTTNLLLKMAGYESPKKTCGADGNTSDAAVPDSQQASVVQVIRYLVGPIPAALIVLATVAAWAFPITRQSHVAEAAETKARREERITAASATDKSEHCGCQAPKGPQDPPASSAAPPQDEETFPLPENVDLQQDPENVLTADARVIVVL